LAADDFHYARAVFRDWQRWHARGRVTVSSWGDAVTGARAARLAYLLHSTGWRDRPLIQLAERHAAKLQDPDFFSTTNHGIAQLHGLAALCLDGKLRSCRGADTFSSASSPCCSAISSRDRVSTVRTRRAIIFMPWSISPAWLHC